MSVLELFGEEAAAEPAALWEWLRAEASSDDGELEELEELEEAGFIGPPPPPPPPPAHADARSLLVGYAVAQGSLRRVLEVVLMLLQAEHAAGDNNASTRVKVCM